MADKQGGDLGIGQGNLPMMLGSGLAPKSEHIPIESIAIQQR